MSQTQIPFQSWCVLFAVGILVFILNIDYTAVNLTLVPISEEIDTDLNNLQWLLSSYVLIWAALVIPAGKVADIYGNNRALMGGLVLFMGGSVLTGLGESVEVLVAGRILQGVGAAIFSAPAWATIFSMVPPERQGFVMGIIMSFAGIGLAIGPTVSGFIIRALGWRWIFYMNIPLGLAIIGILLLYGPKPPTQLRPERLSFLGTGLLVAGLCIGIFGINQIEVWGTHDPRLWAMIGAGILLLGGFWYWNRTRRAPMIPKEIFESKTFVSLLYGTFAMSITFSMVLVLMVLYLQNTLKYTTYETGLIFISMTITMGLLSPLGGKMIDKFGVQKPMVWGAVLVTAATLILSGLTPQSSLLHVGFGLFLVGTGLGCYFTAGNTAMLWAAPKDHMNVASGVYMMFSMLGNTLSVILSTSLVVFFGRDHLLATISQNQVVLSPQQHNQLIEIIAKVEHTKSQLTDFDLGLQDQLLQWIDQAFVAGLRWNFLGATLLLVVLIFWIHKTTKTLKASQEEFIPKNTHH